MNFVTYFQARLLQALTALNRRLLEERGDVPGWVFITLLSAALVAALYAIVGDALINMFRTALANLNNSVG